MKLLNEASGRSMSMSASPKLRSLFNETVNRRGVTHVLESGTFHGLGSTMFIIDAFRHTAPPSKFVTIEANWFSWRCASANLRCFPFVTALWGRTVPLESAIKFISEDDFLENRGDYPDVYIDDDKDPVRFYTDEIIGKLGGSPNGVNQRARMLWDRAFHYAGEGLLTKYLAQFRSEAPLIVLDSAGGIGYLEFSIIEKEMREYCYLLLLDDINHVKHYRSYHHIICDSSFETIGVDQHDGWLLASHLA